MNKLQAMEFLQKHSNVHEYNVMTCTYDILRKYNMPENILEQLLYNNDSYRRVIVSNQNLSSALIEKFGLIGVTTFFMHKINIFRKTVVYRRKFPNVYKNRI